MRAATPRSALVLVAVLAVGVSCSDDSGRVTATTTSATRPATSVADDGILRIGVLLPQSGSAQALGEPLAAAVDLAVAEINQAGGVNGQQVEVVHADEGDSVATASKGVADLVQARVDAVIGPASSRIALAVLDSFVDEGILTCSPTATASALSTFPDNRFFIRTVPTDSLQGVAMAELVDRAGVSSAAILTPDDAFGRAYAEAIAGGLARRGIAVTAEVGYTAANEDDVVAAIQQALAAGPGAIALVGNSVSGSDVLNTALGLIPSGQPIVVNDVLRTPRPDDALRLAGSDVAGVSPRAAPAPVSAPWFTSTFAAYVGADPATIGPSYAANAYDCVSLIAVAAQAAGRNSATAIVPRLIDISQGGASCTNFTTCSVLLDEQRTVDLNGASGPLELDADGDVSSGWFDRFQFDQDGHDVTDGELLVGSF